MLPRLSTTKELAPLRESLERLKTSVDYMLDGGLDQLECGGFSEPVIIDKAYTYNLLGGFKIFDGFFSPEVLVQTQPGLCVPVV